MANVDPNFVSSSLRFLACFNLTDKKQLNLVIFYLNVPYIIRIKIILYAYTVLFAQVWARCSVLFMAENKQANNVLQKQIVLMFLNSTTWKQYTDLNYVTSVSFFPPSIADV